ncbi:MAG: glycine cleavage system protein GcvH [Legionellaceae bacterium]
MTNDTALKFSKTHEWLREEHDEYVIGITDHAQHLLGDLVFIELPDLGQDIKTNQACGVIESVKAASDLYAPISGTVIAINDTVKREPQLVNTDPMGAGWLIKIKAQNPEEISQLMNKTQYDNEIIKDH